MEQTPPQTRTAGARFVLWVALGAALAVTTVWATAMAAGPRFVGMRRALRSLGLSAQEAGRAEAAITHEFRVEMLWTAVSAAALLVCWVVATRYVRARRAPLAPRSRKGRLGLGVLLGVLGFGFVALPITMLAYRIAHAGQGSF